MSEQTLWNHWQGIPWQKRNQIIAHYGLKRSAETKVRTGSHGEGILDDDGIRENDLARISHMAIEDVLALKPVETSESIKSELEPPPIIETKSEPKKRGIKPNAKTTKSK